MAEYLSAGIAYLLGAFPAAYFFSRLIKKVDIRTVGSGNVGGMNTMKQVGAAAGLLTIAIDTGKGALAVYLASLLGGGLYSTLTAAWLAVLAHNFNPFLGFRGGKGLATTFGAFLVLCRPCLFFMLLLALALALALHDTGTGVGLAAALLPALFWVLFRDWTAVLLGALLGLVIAVKHIKDFRAYARGRRQLF